jgi:1-acyl-sn-glycerol-3-phosphate acyltransferase
VYKNRFRRWFVDTLELVVPMADVNPMAALRVSEGILQRGGRLLNFPEGAVEGSQEGRLLPLKHGASLLSLLSGVPLLPVGFTGTKELWLRRTITMRVGKPIYPDQFPELLRSGDRRASARTLTSELESSLLALLPGDHERARVKLLREWLIDLFR